MIAHIWDANRLTATACCSPSSTGQADINVALLFFYLPVLVVIPLLLIAGILLVVVPGGFIILFIGAYYAAAGIIQLVVIAVVRALLSARESRARSARGSIAAAPASLTAVHPS